MSDNAVTKAGATHDVWAEHVDDDAGHAANQEEHELGAIAAIRKQPKVFAWCLYALFTCLLVSFENQASGMVLSIPEFRKDFGHAFEGSYVLDTKWQSAFYGAPLASTIIGTFGASPMADKFGRKPVLIGSILVSFAAIAIEFVSTRNEMFFGGKFLNGFTTGIILTVALAYVGEIVPLALRGFLTCLSALMFTIGPLTSAIIVNFTGAFESRWAYRSVFCAQFGFAGIAALFMFFMPESPVWLISKDRADKAARSLRRLGFTDFQVTKKVSQMKITLEQAKRETEGASYLECFKKSNLRRTIISIMPLSIQALSGVYFIAAYGTYYIQLAGYSTEDSFKLQIGQHGISMAGNICSWFLVDNVGRRPLTLYGTCIVTVILMVCAGLAVQGSTSAIKGSVAMLLIYNFFYNVTIGATAYTLVTEVATSRLRAKTISIGVAMQYVIYTVWAFVIPYLFNPDQANLGAKTAFIFGGLGVLCIVYLWFYQVETSGRSYEELDELFQKGISVRDFKSYVTEAQQKGQEAKESKAEM
ncbi:putative Major facilitator superfamily (MFS) profile domain-containing protein [Seiridium cardinale]|uniref:Major facilitator superfamily (MFS) profile domain-containing protein n=1 Tax=Seiridium cardinale TaxID=138064 RepID=A0ABR2Y1Q3_9PEZI